MLSVVGDIGGEAGSADGAAEQGHTDPIGDGQTPDNNEPRQITSTSPTDGLSAGPGDTKPALITILPTGPGLEPPAPPQLLPLSVSRGAVQEDEDNDGNDQWVNVEGMLRLAAAVATDEPTTVAHAPAAAAVAAAADGEEHDRGRREALSAAVVAPELLKLMREVVGQQRGLGEERSALMQVCVGGYCLIIFSC